MAKVKVCLDLPCNRFILLDSGTTIITPSDCKSGKPAPQDVEQKIAHIAKETKETVWASKNMFKNAKEGSEIDI